MILKTGKFKVQRIADTANAVVLEQDGLVIGRLQSCDVVLNHKSVSRIHAGINFVENTYFLINLSVSNSVTLNGHLLASRAADVLADGDIIQIGPFAITVAREEDVLAISVSEQFAGDLKTVAENLPATEKTLVAADEEITDVLQVFWEKRTREKEEWGTALRPKDKPQPGKAAINWKPSKDLRSAWRVGVFVWVILIFGFFTAFAFFRYPNTFAPKPLSNPHAQKIDASSIANLSNENSCTTCHAWNEPMENSCVKCHRADEFHASNTKAHADAGISCATCHVEHRGEDFDSRKFALESCATCHNDNNRQLYNGKAVRTAHGGTFGYPVENGNWTWKGLHRETVETLFANAIRNTNEQKRLSEQFHAIHSNRLIASGDLQSDEAGRVSCSTCHKSFAPVDRETPRQTCATCHNGFVDDKSGEVIFAESQANCVSCHVQHPFEQNRWREFLSDEARKQRESVVAAQIKRLNAK
jgi:pSer/pThr/pTyr-binding forkhead associated (FHA) protein